MSGDKFSMILDLDKQIKNLLVSGSKEEAEVLKMQKSAALLAAKEAGEDQVSDEVFMAVLRKQIKMRLDAVESYTKGGAKDAATKESLEAELLSQMLPEQLSDEELSVMVDDIASSEGIVLERPSMGRLIGAVSKKAGESASKSDIARIINSKIGT